MFACIHVPGLPPEETARLVQCACDYSPQVEQTAPDTVVIKAAGLARLFGSAHELAQSIARNAREFGFRAHVAIASNPDTAVHAACGIPGITVVPPGKEVQILGPLPLELLAPPPEIADTLATWGIYTFADLAALPEAGIAERLGPQGVRLHNLARGAGDRPLVPLNPEPAFTESLELEYAVTLLEPLSFLLSRLLNTICEKLESHGLATHEIRLVLRLENETEHIRTLRLPYPMKDSAVFLKLLKLDLEGHPPQGPIVRVTLTAEPVNPRVVQTGLFIPRAPEPQKLELTLARISKIVGEGNAGSPELVDTHRPGAFRMKRFVVQTSGPAARNCRPTRLALRVFRPALHARVQSPSGRPMRIEARGIRGTVVSSAGPWRTSGDWWTPDPWSRDEWDVAVSNGTLYRIYLDHISGDWFIEGAYD